MQTGSVVVAKPRDVVIDRLRMILAAANCEVEHSSDSHIRFRHGTYLTGGTATQFPKRCSLWLDDLGDATRIRYEVAVAPFIAVWFTIFGVLLCWLIAPPILAHRVLVYHPRRFMENLLAGV